MEKLTRIAQGGSYESKDFGDVRRWTLYLVNGARFDHPAGESHLCLCCYVVCGECGGDGRYEEFVGTHCPETGYPDTRGASCEECCDGVFELERSASVSPEVLATTYGLEQLRWLCDELALANADPAILGLSAETIARVTHDEPELAKWFASDRPGVASTRLAHLHPLLVATVA